MRSLAQDLRRFLASEDGPTTVEYALMLALILVACMATISMLGAQSSATFTKVAASLGDGS